MAYNNDNSLLMEDNTEEIIPETPEPENMEVHHHAHHEGKKN